MRVLGVLMWHHWLVRKRRFIVTFFELLTPIIGLIVMFWARKFFLDLDMEKSPETLMANFHTTKPVRLRSFESTKPISMVLYYPSTKLSDVLMDAVGIKLGLSRLYLVPGTNSRGYYAMAHLSSEYETKLLQGMNDTSAIVRFWNCLLDVEFEDITNHLAYVIPKFIQPSSTWRSPNLNLGGREYPSKLNYTIRMNVDYLVYFMPLDGDIRPNQSYSSMYEPFMRLQWAIDTSYIKMRTSRDVDREIYLEEVPLQESTDPYPQAVIVVVLVRILCDYGPCIPYVFLVQRLMQYRETGLEELIKMVGVTPFMFRLSHFLNMMPSCLLFSLAGPLFLKMSSTPLLPETNYCILAIMLVLHFIAVIFLAFNFSHISNSSKHALNIATLSYLLMQMLRGLALNNFDEIPKSLHMVCGLLPFVPHTVFWNNVAHYEKIGEGVNFKNFLKNPLEIFSTFVCLCLTMCQALVFAVLAWYVALARPGKYGVAVPCSTLLTPRCFAKKGSANEELALAEAMEPTAQDPRYFEAAPKNADVGIKISNVTKIYGTNRVLSNVTFDVYKGEITVLLGHNGAGKTTLMSVITGMTSLTSGTVFVNGLSLASNFERVRSHLGLCPQHNVEVPYLTLHQQVMFFALLKGQKYQEARESSKVLLNQLGLGSKLDNLAGQLSGGMKRRLQLACALSGGSTVLILDEPTSGLDVETRRELWDLLLALRGQHTVLLSTHFMEEADALGDRVASLHGGVLKCHATPMFLKKSIGTGYRLSLTTVGLPMVDAITGLITSIVPQAVLKEQSYNSVTYTLPSQDSNKFPQLFSSLESKRAELNIESIGVGVTTLEEVFLKLSSNVDTQFTDESVATDTEERPYAKRNGPVYYLRVMGLLMMRQLRYLSRNIFMFALLNIVIPILLLALITVLTVKITDEKKADSKTTTLSELQATDLNLYRGLDNSRFLYQMPEHSVFRSKEPYKYYDVAFQITHKKDSHSNILKATLKLPELNMFISGTELNESSAKLKYASSVRHAAPVALNMLSNLLAGKTHPPSSIATYNEPLQSTAQAVLPLEKADLDFWIIMVIILIFSQLAGAAGLPLAERQQGTRHIHIMAGCPPALHWLATLSAHTLIYTVCLTVPSLLLALFDERQTINNPLFIGTMFMILLVGATAWLPVGYLVQFYSNSITMLLLMILIFLGVVPATVMIDVNYDVEWYLFWPARILNYISPPYTATSASMYAATVARQNAICALNTHFCPQLQAAFPKCCGAPNPFCYLCMQNDTPMKDIIILIIQTIIYMLLVIATEYGFIGTLWRHLADSRYKPQPPTFKDPMVLAEKSYVDETIVLPINQIPDAMLVSDVHKRYFRCRHPCTPFQAIKGVNFSVKKGECFGLLGVNGAGKSTTFKVITAEVTPTHGRCYANSHHLQCYKIPYMQSLGYCPQFFGMDDFMTGRQNLKLLLMIRGMRSEDIEKEVDAWIAVGGLERYANLRVSAYSGGCARRLAAVAALATDAAITLLDEPTAGVDVAARRRVWLAVRKGLRNQRAIVLTSHSMDEMEALCQRIAIMVAGEVAALGSAPALRAAHAAGYALVFKVHATPGDGPDSAVAVLKMAIEQKFKATLTDEHKTTLHYHIEDSMPYSELFRALEQLKQDFPGVIEDYSVSETTLEEAFLSYAQPRDANSQNVTDKNKNQKKNTEK